MKSKKICYCKICGTLDYADGKCPKCGSTEIDEASMDFLLFGSDSYPLYSGIQRKSVSRADGCPVHGQGKKSSLLDYRNEYKYGTK